MKKSDVQLKPEGWQPWAEEDRNQKSDKMNIIKIKVGMYVHTVFKGIRIAKR